MSLDHHNHNHNHLQTEAITVPLLLNLGFTILEFVGAWFTNSMAIFTDAFHDLGDTLSLGLMWGLANYSQKGSDKKYTYGYQRFRLLGVLFTTLTLIAGAVYTVIEGIRRLSQPEDVKPGGILILAIIGVVVNGYSIWRLHQKKGLSEKVMSLHLFEDLIGWISVLIAAVVMLIVYLPILDTILSFFLALFITYNALSYLVEILRILLLANPFNTQSSHIIDQLLKSPEIVDVHDFHMFSLDGENNIITLHVVTTECEVENIANLREWVRDQLHEFSTHCTIEIEQEGYACLHKNSCYDLNDSVQDHLNE